MINIKKTWEKIQLHIQHNLDSFWINLMDKLVIVVKFINKHSITKRIILQQNLYFIFTNLIRIESFSKPVARVIQIIITNEQASESHL